MEKCVKHGYMVCPHCCDEVPLKKVDSSLPRLESKVMRYRTFGVNRQYYWE